MAAHAAVGYARPGMYMAKSVTRDPVVEGSVVTCVVSCIMQTIYAKMGKRKEQMTIDHFAPQVCDAQSPPPPAICKTPAAPLPVALTHPSPSPLRQPCGQHCDQIGSASLA
jgi:hypothetical protein